MANVYGPAFYKKTAEEMLTEIEKDINKFASKIPSYQTVHEFNASGLNGKVKYAENKIEYFIKENGEYCPVPRDKFVDFFAHFNSTIQEDAKDNIERSVKKAMADGEYFSGAQKIEENIEIIKDENEIEFDTKEIQNRNCLDDRSVNKENQPSLDDTLADLQKEDLINNSSIPIKSNEEDLDNSK